MSRANQRKDFMYLARAKQRYHEMLQVLGWFDEAKPCTIEEVKALEQKLGLPLPLAYQEFLLWMGHHCGKYLWGEDYRFSQLEWICEGLVDLVNLNEFAEPLPEDIIVFTMHEGYDFGFVRASEGDNPPIHFCTENSQRQGVINWNFYNTLEDYLLAYIEATIKLCDKTKRNNG